MGYDVAVWAELTFPSKAALTRWRKARIDAGRYRDWPATFGGRARRRTVSEAITDWRHWNATAFEATSDGHWFRLRALLDEEQFRACCREVAAAVRVADGFEAEGLALFAPTDDQPAHAIVVAQGKSTIGAATDEQLARAGIEEVLAAAEAEILAAQPELAAIVAAADAEIDDAVARYHATQRELKAELDAALEASRDPVGTLFAALLRSERDRLDFGSETVVQRLRDSDDPSVGDRAIALLEERLAEGGRAPVDEQVQLLIAVLGGRPNPRARQLLQRVAADDARGVYVRIAACRALITSATDDELGRAFGKSRAQLLIDEPAIAHDNLPTVRAFVDQLFADGGESFALPAPDEWLAPPARLFEETAKLFTAEKVRSKRGAGVAVRALRQARAIVPPDRRWVSRCFDVLMVEHDDHRIAWSLGREAGPLVMHCDGRELLDQLDTMLAGPHLASVWAIALLGRWGDAQQLRRALVYCETQPPVFALGREGHLSDAIVRVAHRQRQAVTKLIRTRLRTLSPRSKFHYAYQAALETIERGGTPDRGAPALW